MWFIIPTVLTIAAIVVSVCSYYADLVTLKRVSS